MGEEEGPGSVLAGVSLHPRARRRGGKGVGGGYQREKEKRQDHRAVSVVSGDRQGQKENAGSTSITAEC